MFLLNRTVPQTQISCRIILSSLVRGPSQKEREYPTCQTCPLAWYTLFVHVSNIVRVIFRIFVRMRYKERGSCTEHKNGSCFTAASHCTISRSKVSSFVMFCGTDTVDSGFKTHALISKTARNMRLKVRYA